MKKRFKKLKERGTFKEDPISKCSFCGRGQEEAKKLIVGPKVFICSECVELCNEIIKDEEEEKS